MQHYKINPETLKLELVKIKRSYSAYIITAIILMLLGFSSGVKVKTIVERIPVIMTTKEQECNQENVKAFIVKLNVKFPKIVYQQVMLESNSLQSPIAKELNNLVCMENARSRPTTGSDIGTRFARYDNWKQSLVDYALWQTYMARDITSEEDYYYLLDNLYCDHRLKENAGPLYSTRLKQISWD